MFSPAERKNIEEMIDQDKKREEWEGKFPGNDTGGVGLSGGIL
jgi:hypothetical protein